MNLVHQRVEMPRHHERAELRGVVDVGDQRKVTLPPRAAARRALEQRLAESIDDRLNRGCARQRRTAHLLQQLEALAVQHLGAPLEDRA